MEKKTSDWNKYKELRRKEITNIEIRRSTLKVLEKLKLHYGKSSRIEMLDYIINEFDFKK